MSKKQSKHMANDMNGESELVEQDVHQANTQEENEVESSEVIDASKVDENENVDNDDDVIEVETSVIEDESLEIAKALVSAEAALKESQDRYQRTIAEFDNFRKRTLKEKSTMYENGAKEVLEKLLPVVDNFERAISHIAEDEKELSITQGVQMIYKQLMSTLDELGVKEIEAHLQEFDPNLHHAVSHEENDDYDDNLVQEVFQKGYMFKDTVLRHSMVKVVN